MNRPIAIPNSFISDITRRSPAAQAWIEKLPGIIREISDTWHLSVDGGARYGKTSMVIPVRKADEPAALKLVTPAGDVESEAQALELLSGSSVVELLKASIEHGALLFQRLEGNSPMDSLTAEEAVAVAGKIAASIATVSAPSCVETFASRAVGWPTGLRQQHATALREGKAFPTEQFDLALEIIVEMQSDSSTTMTHGDLSMENILQTTSGSWVAIDPYLLCGPVENEAHTVVRSLLPRIMDSENPAKQLDDLTKVFCDAAGADFEQARRISFARYIASYYWEAQNSESSANTERLRQATHLTFEAVASS